MISTKLGILGVVTGGALYYFMSPSGDVKTSESLPISQLNSDLQDATSPPSKNLLFRSMYCGAPHPSKRHLNPDPTKQFQSFGAGEDSGFISPLVLGLGDGVGGWSKNPNANVALFSRLLMHHARDFLQSKDDLVAALRHARGSVPANVIGSSTCVLVRYDQSDCKFKTANLGDSNYMLIRDNSIHHMGETTSNAFNFPKQIGTRGNEPEEAALEIIDAEEGDILVLSSDGLWDNLFTEEVLNIVNDYTDNGVVRADKASQALVRETLQMWQSPRDSPFAEEAKRQGQYFSGAKIDDVVVIVSQLMAQRSNL